jgi:hypothetical protein
LTESEEKAMRGNHFAALKLLALPALVLGAVFAAAGDAPAQMPAPDQPIAVIVLDASKTMGEKLGTTTKLDLVREALGETVASHEGTLSLGLVALGHGAAKGCEDSAILAKPGELGADSYDMLLGDLKAKGEAPIGAAITTAATMTESDAPLDVVLLADGPGTCKVDLCATAEALKDNATGLRIHILGVSEQPEDIQPLACMAETTGGTFIAASDEAAIKDGLEKLMTALAMQFSAPTTAEAAQDADQSSLAINKQGETAVFKSGAQSMAQRAMPAPSEGEHRPVPVSFKALMTEDGPKLNAGLIWRIYNAEADADGTFTLISTHREPNPTAALLPGEYLVNAAYGLSNLTRKIEVLGGESLDETFVLNTGGLAMRAVLATGEECPQGSVRFDILSDERDQFGNRETILAAATPRRVIRLNAGAYHIRSLYGDANASVGVDITVEPGKITEATIKHTGAKITFRLVQDLGGEALANTRWRILTSAGDTVKSNAGALPTHILAAGSYAVVADHDGQSYTRRFSIEPGSDKQIEVAISDGPTSPEALKALLDPPEATPPGTGALAGEGPGGDVGFDGFSRRPADPNAPLINPGTLFRPSTP